MTLSSDKSYLQLPAEHIVSQEKYLIQIYRKKLEENYFKENSQRITKLENQLNVGRILSHHGIVKMVDIFDSKDYFYMCYEHNLGPIKGTFEETALKDLALPLLEGLVYLHDLGIVLRNFQMSSILLNSKNEPLISNFEESVIIGPDQQIKGKVNQIAYSSPKVV